MGHHTYDDEFWNAYQALEQRLVRTVEDRDFDSVEGLITALAKLGQHWAEDHPGQSLQDELAKHVNMAHEPAPNEPVPEKPVTPISAFKMSSGEEVLFVGIRTGKLAQMVGAPKSVADRLEHNPFGHLISHPYVVVNRADGGLNLKRWPTVAAFGTCQQIFVPDRDVTFQLVEAEIDPVVLNFYRRLLATTPEGKPTE